MEVNGCLSGVSGARSEVPQGTVLGPLLFVIFITDIDAGMLSTKIASFADDTRIMKEIRTGTDCEELQTDLEKMYFWVHQNNMMLNDGKFEVLRYGNHPMEEKTYKTPDGMDISFMRSVKDLGIEVQADAKFTEHIDKIVNKCRRQIGWILRTFTTREPEPMLTLYKALVVPIAEYCCQLWCPVAVGQIASIEGIQRTFTSRIAGLQNYNYWERLKKLSLYSLQRRRERYVIIYVWKIIQGLAPNFQREDLRIRTHGEESRLGRRCQLPPLVRSGEGSLRDRSFSVTGPKLFNELPATLREFSGSLDAFKRRLEKFLEGIDDRPPLPGYVSAAGGNSIVQQLAHSRAQTL